MGVKVDNKWTKKINNNYKDGITSRLWRWKYHVTWLREEKQNYHVTWVSEHKQKYHVSWVLEDKQKYHVTRVLACSRRSDSGGAMRKDASVNWGLGRWGVAPPLSERLEQATRVSKINKSIMLHGFQKITKVLYYMGFGRKTKVSCIKAARSYKIGGKQRLMLRGIDPHRRGQIAS